jgi:hypothetical protein
MTTHTLGTTHVGAVTFTEPKPARRLHVGRILWLLWLAPAATWAGARAAAARGPLVKRLLAPPVWLTLGFVLTTLAMLAGVLLPGRSVWFHSRAVTLVRRTRKGPWRLGDIAAFPPGRGHASRLLDEICRSADASHDGAGVAIVTRCDDDSMPSLYARHGFRARHVDSGERLRIRRPVRP